MCRHLLAGLSDYDLNFSTLCSGIRDAFDRRREYQLGDSIRYFLDNLDKTNKVEYLPDQSDILHARKATKGINESKIIIDSKQL